MQINLGSAAPDKFRGSDSSKEKARWEKRLVGLLLQQQITVYYYITIFTENQLSKCFHF